MAATDEPAPTPSGEVLEVRAEPPTRVGDGEDVYVDIARRYIASGTGQRRGYGEWLIPTLLEDRAWLDTVDAGRVQLLAELATARAEIERLNRVSDLNPLGRDLSDACCVDAYASRDKAQALHTSECPNRCSVQTPCPPGARVRAYPCALTVGHLEDHWIHPSYRAEPAAGDGGAK